MLFQPASIMQSTQRFRLSRSSSPVSVKVVGATGKTPANRGARRAGGCVAMPIGSEHEVAAVDVQHLPRDVLRSRACKERAAQSDLFRASHAPHRNHPRSALSYPVATLFASSACRWRRRDSADSDVATGVFARERFDESANGSLGHRVHRRAGITARIGTLARKQDD